MINTLKSLVSNYLIARKIGDNSTQLAYFKLLQEVRKIFIKLYNTNK